jgi:peptidyl-prolyl cis-trans isomerase C
MDIRKLAAVLGLALAVTACDSKTPNKKGGDAGTADASAEAVEAKADAGAEAKADNAGPPAPFIAEGPVAIVNGKEVPASEFNEAAERLGAMGPGIPASALDTFKEQLVQRLIDDALVKQAVADDVSSVTAKDVEEEFARFMENFQNPEDVKVFYERTGMDEATLKKEMKTSIAVKRLLQEKYDGKVSDDAIKDYYEKNKARFEKNDEVKASHILLKLAKDAKPEQEEEVKKKAEQLAKEAKGGADFAKLASEHSEGPTKSKGGDLGFFDRKRMVPAFADAAFKLKPGEVSDPVKTQFGYHVIKVMEKRDARTVPLDEAREEIEKTLERTQLRDGMRKLMTDLKSNASIERKDGDNVKVNPEFEKLQKQQPPQAPGGMPGGGLKLNLPQGGGQQGGTPGAGDQKLQLKMK